MSNNQVVTIEQAYIIALNNYFQDNFSDAINILLQIIKSGNNHVPSLFLYASINIICNNITEGLNIFEQMLSLKSIKLDDEMKDEILEVTSHFIYYSDINIAANYPEIAKLHREIGIEI